MEHIKKSMVLLSILIIILLIVAYSTEKDTSGLTGEEVKGLALQYLQSNYNEPFDAVMGNITHYDEFKGKKDISVIPIQFNYIVPRSSIEKQAIQNQRDKLTGFAAIMPPDPNKELDRANCITVTGQLIVTRDEKVIPMTYHKPCE